MPSVAGCGPILNQVVASSLPFLITLDADACDNSQRSGSQPLLAKVLKRMSKTRALLVLSAFCLLFLTLATTAIPPAPISPAHGGDIATYRNIVSRLKAGEPYYIVVGDELRRGHYATREAFNSRTPLLWTALARVSDVVGGGVLIGLSVFLLSATVLVTLRESRWTVGGSAFMQAGSILFVGSCRPSR